MKVRRGLKDATRWARLRAKTPEAERELVQARLEAIEERAGILEYEAGLPRAEAERRAHEMHGGADGL